MPTCNHCHSHVSDAFARVFADSSGRVRACLNCSTHANVARETRARSAER